MDKTIGTFNRLLSVERYAVSSVKATPEGRNLETSQRNLLKSLRELGKSGNLPMIVAVERRSLRQSVPTTPIAGPWMPA